MLEDMRDRYLNECVGRAQRLFRAWVKADYPHCITECEVGEVLGEITDHDLPEPTLSVSTNGPGSYTLFPEVHFEKDGLLDIFVGHPAGWKVKDNSGLTDVGREHEQHYVTACNQALLRWADGEGIWEPYDCCRGISGIEAGEWTFGGMVYAHKEHYDEPGRLPALFPEINFHGKRHGSHDQFFGKLVFAPVEFRAVHRGHWMLIQPDTKNEEEA